MFEFSRGCVVNNELRKRWVAEDADMTDDKKVTVYIITTRCHMSSIPFGSTTNYKLMLSEGVNAVNGNVGG